MILSVSRRTDIPAFFTQWFMNRLREGYVLVPQVRNPRRYYRIPLNPDTVDCIVFWTKNPGPLLPYLSEIRVMGYRFYFQFTLTGYGKDIEPGLPDKWALVEAFQALSKEAGKDCTVWRYDPVLLDDVHTIQWHTEAFGRLCGLLAAHTGRCVISFLDMYAKLGKRFRELTQEEIHIAAAAFSKIAGQHRLPLYTCAEAEDLSEYGIQHGACVDLLLAEKAAGYPLRLRKELGRPACGCAQSIDIGVYDTCAHGCTYCYANKNSVRAAAHAEVLNPDAPSLLGWPPAGTDIIEREAISCRKGQLSLFGED